MSKIMNLSDNVKELDIKFSYGEFRMVTGPEFLVQTEGYDDEAVIIEEVGERFVIRDERKKTTFLGATKRDNYIIQLVIPEERFFERVKISTGAAEFRVDSLKANILKLEMGAGEITFDHLEVVNYAKISGGAGELRVNAGSINDMQLSLGAGQVDISAAITGDSKLSAGVGELNLQLQGSADDYSVTVSKGIGACNVYGAVGVNGKTYGNGANRIQVNGGVGEINIRFEV